MWKIYILVQLRSMICLNKKNELNFHLSKGMLIFTMSIGDNLSRISDNILQTITFTYAFTMANDCQLPLNIIEILPVSQKLLKGLYHSNSKLLEKIFLKMIDSYFIHLYMNFITPLWTIMRPKLIILEIILVLLYVISRKTVSNYINTDPIYRFLTSSIKI